MKLYVGNLPWSVDDNALKELFTSYGDIEEAVLIKDKFSGRSKGFGFVTFKDDEAASKAIAEMHEKEIEGRALTVSEARPMERRDDSPKYDSGNSDEQAGAPLANPSEINESTPEIVDDNSDAEEGEKDIETADEAVEDAEETKEEDKE